MPDADLPPITCLAGGTTADISGTDLYLSA